MPAPVASEGQEPERSRRPTPRWDRVTIADVALRAHTSPATVSRHLNGIPVRPATAASIDRAVRESHYRANAHARSLRKAQSNTVGFLITDPIDTLFADPVFAVLARECSSALAATQRNMVMLLADGPEERRRTLDYLQGDHVDAVIVANHSDSNTAFVTGLAEARVPLLVAGSWDDLTLASNVVSDAASGIAESARHLVGHGRRRVAIIGGRAEPDGTQPRIDNYAKALGPAFRPDLVYPGEQDAEASIKELAKRTDVDAIVAHNDVTAALVIETLLRAGRRVPDDVAVVGYDNVVTVCESTRPRLTSVGQDFHRMAAEFVRLLDARERGEGNSSAQLPTRLVLRESA